MHHFIYYAKLNAGSACMPQRGERKEHIRRGKKFSELDGARNCVAGNGHVSRSDNRKNNCPVSRITEAFNTVTANGVMDVPSVQTSTGLPPNEYVVLGYNAQLNPTMLQRILVRLTICSTTYMTLSNSFSPPKLYSKGGKRILELRQSRLDKFNLGTMRKELRAYSLALSLSLSLVRSRVTRPPRAEVYLIFS
ncbi:hypothetical protein PUN28_016686 [Cardiocondyla obscurior]|uniref:Uncharacterized protein n=1 Tax=Cardiocondyla obscurior TaxID=286306 RepID=A0AAW2EN94_9HYME